MNLTLKQARRVAEKTQRETAKYLGINVDTYRSIEKDPERATIYQAKALPLFFGISYDEIFFTGHPTLSSESKSA